jgi:phage-related protein
MSTALPLTNYISQRSFRTRKNRVLSAQFGDGYSQEAPDGTNALTDEWSVVYENLSSTNRNTVFAALDAVGAWDYLTWTAPGDGSSKKWKVTKDGVSEQASSGSLYSISFKVRQVY